MRPHFISPSSSLLRQVWVYIAIVKRPLWDFLVTTSLSLRPTNGMHTLSCLQRLSALLHHWYWNIGLLFMVIYPMERIPCIFTSIGSHCSSDFLLLFVCLFVCCFCLFPPGTIIAGWTETALSENFTQQFFTYPALRIEPRTFILNPVSLSPQPHAPISNAEYKISLMITIGLKCPAECNS